MSDHRYQYDCFCSSCNGKRMIPVTQEKLYTLEEAEKELTREKCSLNGHEFTIVANGTGTPVGLICSICGRNWRVISGR